MRESFSGGGFLSIRPSVRLLLLILVIHTLALAGVWLAGIGVWLQAALTLAIVLHGCHVAFSDVLLQGQHAVRQLRWQKDGRCQLLLAGGETVDVVRCGETLLVHELAALRLQTPCGSQTFDLLLFNDSADGEALRRFRTWLNLADTRWQPGPGETGYPL